MSRDVPFPSGQQAESRHGRPLALVYRGPAAGPACSEALAECLRSSPWGFQVSYVGPKERLPLTAESLSRAHLYAQPGGGTLKKAYRRMAGSAKDIRRYVSAGGRYLGVCLGGYLAGASPGFNLLPGDTDRFIDSPGATVGTDRDTVVQVRWRGRPRHMYFQDGPHFILQPGALGVQVLATYTNGAVAALVSSHGRGAVGVVGPHPEATEDWYEDSDRANPDGLRMDLAHDLVDSLMRQGA